MEGTFEDDDMVFYEKDRQVVPSQHIKPLYMTAHINDVELRHTMVDLGSSLNIVHLSTLGAVEIP